MNRKSGTTMLRTLSDTASADTEALAMGLTVNTSSSNSHAKNALMTDQCVLIVSGARPVFSMASLSDVMNRCVTMCGNIEPIAAAHYFDQCVRSLPSVDSAPLRLVLIRIRDCRF